MHFSLNNSGMNVTAGIDTERERVYQKAEQMDAQLQRMSEDLKVIPFCLLKHGWVKSSSIIYLH
jgi:hypothetical protein